MTPQGRAIQLASIRFGNGKTLPFTPCKKGYIPINAIGKHMCACPLHETARRERLESEGLTFRKGEVNLNNFWNKKNDDTKPQSSFDEDSKIDETS